MPNAQLVQNLKRLRLSGLLTTLEVRLQEAAGNSLDHSEFLELIVADELAIRSDRAIARRIKSAGFREKRTIEDFDFTFNPSINRRQIACESAARTDGAFPRSLRRNWVRTSRFWSVRGWSMAQPFGGVHEASRSTRQRSNRSLIFRSTPWSVGS